jgi:hypothetical protein
MIFRVFLEESSAKQDMIIMYLTNNSRGEKNGLEMVGNPNRTPIDRYYRGSISPV